MSFTAAQRDRGCGALLASAAGDALGAGYEFGPPLAPDVSVDMIGGGLGPFKPGEWTDDTSMAIVIAQVAATGADLRGEEAQDDIVELWNGGQGPLKTLATRLVRFCLLRPGKESRLAPPAKSRLRCMSALAIPPAMAR